MVNKKGAVKLLPFFCQNVFHNGRLISWGISVLVKLAVFQWQLNSLEKKIAYKTFALNERSSNIRPVASFGRHYFISNFS
jgi:fatty-acid desaturase